MNSKERVSAAWNGNATEIPLTTWCFGISPSENIRWNKQGEPVKYWYSLRMEHIHTFPKPWTLEDDFQRVLAWQKLGVDDILDVSVPWSVHPDAFWVDEIQHPGSSTDYPILTRKYTTPAGKLEHSVRKTNEVEEGWVIQPDYVPLFEDYNIPRAVKHVVSTPSEVKPIRYLYTSPDGEAKKWFTQRMNAIRGFTQEHPVPVQAWAAFGMDGVVWLTGVERAVMMAMDEPQAFSLLVESIAETDYGRVELAAADPGVDMIIQRGWYSSTDFWSPRLIDRYVIPYVKKLADLSHQYGKKFGYTVTTGIERIGPRLADSGVDVLYFVDPVQDDISLEKV